MKPRGRPDPAAERARFRATEAFYAVPQKPMGPIFPDEPAKPKRAAPKPSLVPYESTVQTEIIAYLRTREDIGAITRLNSGQAVEHGSDGSTRYIMFNRTAKGMRICDLQCMLKPSGRLVEIEVKRPGFRMPKSPREREQANSLSHIATCGGLGFFACSVDDVKRQLP